MGYRLQIRTIYAALIAVLFSARLSFANEEQNVLESARAALLASDEPLANSYYKQIRIESPLFAEKITDLIRYHLLQQHWLQSWQLTQLAQRIRLATQEDEWSYYRDLALALNGTCSLGESYVVPDGRTELLAAYHYRFPLRFTDAGDGYGGSEALSIQIPRTSVHFLADIVRAKPVKGRGCRLYRSRLTDVDKAKAYELEALLDWYKAILTPQQGRNLAPGAERVLVRILVLSSASKDNEGSAVVGEIAQYFASMDEKRWLNLATDEAIWLWQKLIEAKLKPSPDQVGNAELKLVKELIQASKSGRASEWFGYIPLTAWTDLGERQKIVEHLLTIAELPERAYFQASLADIYHQRGRWQDALKIVRDVLVEQGGSARAEVNGFCIDLTGRILAEYRYSNEVLGALQTSLPREQWRQTLQNLMLIYALQGDAQSFKRVNAAVSATSKTGDVKKFIFAKQEDEILELIATRRVTAFASRIDELSKSKRVRESSLRFLVALMKNSLQLDVEDQRNLQPFFSRLAEYCRHLLANGAERKTAEDLLHFYAEHTKNSWIEGSRDARAGVQSAGTVNIRESFTLVNPFTFARAVPPLPQLLLFMPTDVTSRHWHIATEFKDTVQ